MDINMACEKINRYLADNRSRAEVWPCAGGADVVEAEISWGDWKHDHLYLKWLMEQLGCFRISCEVTEDNGSDCYSAVHRYVVNREYLEKKLGA